MKAKLQFVIFFFLLALTWSNLNAQQKHFIYIQADNKQPFYVIINGKNYSSSSIGYIILSKLDSGNYDLTIGFPKNIYPEQKFAVNVDNQDYGYTLKNFGDKGWGLFNLKTLDVIMSNTNADSSTSAQAAGSSAVETKKNNPFGEMLSDVVNDSTLTRSTPASSAADQKDVASSQSIQADTVNINTSTDSTTITDTNNDSIAVSSKDTSAIAENETDTSDNSFDTKGIIKAEETNTSQGTNLVFIDFNKSENDTIHVLIPSDTSDNNNSSDNNNLTATSADTSTQSVAINDSSSTDRDTSTTAVTTTDEKPSSSDTSKQISNPFFTNNASKNEDNQTSSTNTDSTLTDSTPTKSSVNSSCTNVLTDNEVNKLKKKLMLQTETDEMIQTVKKNLKGKCISTDEVKELGSLFISDESRYNFFDAIYPYVSDSANFASLENQLFDNYYKNRFKALLR